MLLASPDLLRRLDEPSLSFLKEALVARFLLGDIGEDESIDFLRHQLQMRHRDDEERGISPIVLRGLAALGAGTAICIAAFFVVRFIHMPWQPAAGTVTGTYSAPSPLPAAAPPPGLVSPAAPVPAPISSAIVRDHSGSPACSGTVRDDATDISRCHAAAIPARGTRSFSGFRHVGGPGRRISQCRRHRVGAPVL